MVTDEMVEAAAKDMCRRERIDPMSLEPGSTPYGDETQIIDGYLTGGPAGGPAFFRWRLFVPRARATLLAALAAVPVGEEVERAIDAITSAASVAEEFTKHGGKGCAEAASLLRRLSTESDEAKSDASFMRAAHGEVADLLKKAEAERDEAIRQRDQAVEALSGVVGEIAAERCRQVEAEGWTPDHDDQHTDGAIARAAAAYAIHSTDYPTIRGERSRALDWWPWDLHWWKPKDRRRDLIRAAALTVAEIERLDRAAIRQTKGGEHDR